MEIMFCQHNPRTNPSIIFPEQMQHKLLEHIRKIQAEEGCEVTGDSPVMSNCYSSK